MTITPYPTNATTTVTFTITGPSGTIGFCNMTISRTAIPYGATPVVFIDGALAADQGYTQDASNFYLWYTTHFSTHQVEILFKSASTPTPTPTTAATLLKISMSLYFTIIAVAILVVVALVSILMLSRKRRKAIGAVA
jgi:hypothetical protein